MECFLETYKQKDYKGSFYALLDYINPELRQKFGNADHTHFKIPHGSIVIHIKLVGDRIEVKAPFLQLPETNVIPILRKVAEINFWPLNLANIRLEDQSLEFHYECELNSFEPYKMYYLLNEICQTGDKYDDYFTVKHGAKRIYEPIVVPYSSEISEKIWAQVCLYIDEAVEYINYFDNKRWYSESYDIVATTLFKIEYYACPQGNTRNELEDAVAYLNSKNNLHDRINSGKKSLLKIKENGKEAFIADLYQSEIFVPYKKRLSLENLQRNFKDQLNTALKQLNNNNNMLASFTVLYNFLYELYYYSLPVNVENLMIKAMERASHKDWSEAADILVKAMENIVDNNGQVEVSQTSESKKKGFFSRLFSN